MLVDINLLPKKPPKNIANYTTLLLTLLILTIGLAYLYQEARAIQDETKNLNFQKTVIEAESRRIKQEMDKLEVTNAEVMTQQNIIEALNQTIYTTQVIAEMQNHLPENATIASYAYTGGQTLTFRILVNESPEVGNFVESINEISWVTQARVESVTLDQTTAKFFGHVTITLNNGELTKWVWGASG